MAAHIREGMIPTARRNKGYYCKANRGCKAKPGKSGYCTYHKTVTDALNGDPEAIEVARIQYSITRIERVNGRGTK